MTVLYKLVKDIQGFNTYGLPYSDYKESATLAQNVDTEFTVPKGVTMGMPLNQIPKYMLVVMITPGDHVWVALNDTAAIPAGGTFAATTSEMIVGGTPYLREVQGGDIVHFLADTTDVDISISLYGLAAN